MSPQNSSQGVVNFLKVASSAIIRPTRVAAGALAIGTALALPPIAVPVIIGGGIVILSMSWADINDPDFIARVLRPKDSAPINYNNRLDKITQQLKSQNKAASTYPEVTTDITDAIESVEKINQIIATLPKSDQGSISFVVDQLEKLVTRLVDLLNKEQMARNFLNSLQVSEMETELNSLRESLQHINDAVAKKQINKAIDQKEEQVKTYHQVEQRLSRIDAYIANIRAALYTTYSNLARLQLRDDYVLVDEADVLTDSLKQVVDEIDTMDSMMIDIGGTSKVKKKAEKSKLVAHS